MMFMAYEHIKKMLDESGRSQADLARHIGKTPPVITNLFNGTRILKMPEAYEFARFFGKDISEIISGEAINMKVPVTHRVGAGQEVQNIDDYSRGDGVEEVEPPTGHYADDIICAVVQGDSMEPQLENNWLLFYKREHDGVPPDCVGELCVVKLENDGMLVKKVRQGSKPGLFHLLSKNQNFEPLIDQRLQWASRVIDIRPR